MSRRTLIWHVGLPRTPRDVLSASLDAHTERLGADGFRVVATADEARLATHELLRTHREAGLSRDEVEGCWARIADRVWEHKGASLLSTPDLAVADKDQLRLALDPLIGIEVHLVVTVESWSQQLYGAWLAELRGGATTGWEKYVGRVLDRAAEGARGHRQAEDFWAGHELVSVLARWGWTLHADRIHLVVGSGPPQQWASLLDVARVPMDRGGLPVVVPPFADPAGLAVLRRVNRQLDATPGAASLDLLTRTELAAEEARTQLPAVDTSALRPLVERWSSILGSTGYDVRGDLLELVGTEEGSVGLPGFRDQLGAAVDALADALAENSRLRARVGDLEADADRLDEKRRKHKRRLRVLESNASVEPVEAVET